jgi:signal transduction histidine kinase
LKLNAHKTLNQTFRKMPKVLQYFLILFLFGVQIEAQAQRLQLSKEFNKSMAQIETMQYKAELFDSTQVLVNKLVSNSKNDFEKGVALYSKCHLILYGVSDYNVGELALPFALESAKLLSNNYDREWYHKALLLISNCYGSRYGNNVTGSKTANYTIEALRVQTDSNYVPKLNFKDTFDDQKANLSEIKAYIYYAKENLEFWEKKKSYPHMMWRNQILGFLYGNLNQEFFNAEKYSLEALKYSKLIKDDNFSIVILMQLSIFARMNNQLEKAKGYCENNLLIAHKIKNEYREAAIRDQLYFIYKKMGKNDLAFEQKEKSLAISEKYLRNTENMRAKLMREQVVTLEKQVALQDELTSQKNQKLFLVALVSFLTLVILTILYFSYRLKLKNQAISKAMFQGQSIERKRVALDLHDNLGSTISSLKWTLESVNVEKLMPKDKAKIKDLEKMIDVAYAEVRLLSHNLLPEELQKQGLRKALLVLTSKLNSLNKIKFDLDYPDYIEAFSPQVAFEIYSVCLELINNIQKHSEATQAAIKFEKTGADLKIIITDNGIGISDDTKLGHGLQNIEDRLKAINASFEYLAVLPTGTQSIITLK